MRKNINLIIALWFLMSAVNAETKNLKEIKPLTLDGTAYVHRWSQGNQHEYTPYGQEDLSVWSDMVTINIFPDVVDGEQLAQIANNVLSRYETIGAIVRTNSIPRTEKSEAEHLIVAILRGDGVMEAVYARIKMIQGKGTATVWSRRAYGETDAAEAIGAWLQENGEAREKIFMSWEGYPKLTDYDLWSKGY